MTLKTTSQVIKKLGGLKAIMDLTGSNYTTVWNWRKANKFPANTYVLMDSALRVQGAYAPPSLWGMAEAPKRKADELQA